VTLTVQPIDEDTKYTYVALWILKKLDLDPKKHGGMQFPAVLPSELEPLNETLHQMAVDDLVAIHPKRARWELTPRGIDHLRAAIDEASELIEEFDDAETDEMLAELRARNLDPFRARFLWAWFEGELDDLVQFQERRGVRPVERMWAFYLISNEFYVELAKDLAT
jgi:hypothetical protein